MSLSVANSCISLRLTAKTLLNVASSMLASSVFTTCSLWPDAVGSSDQRFVQPRVAIGRRVAGDLELPAGPAHFQPSARPAAVQRRQIAAAIRRKAVQRRADEVQERRLARLVGTVDDVQTLAHPLEFQSAPDAVAFDFQGKQFHSAIDVLQFVLCRMWSILRRPSITQTAFRPWVFVNSTTPY